jgi:methyl-accepting chemotaxis protein
VRSLSQQSTQAAKQVRAILGEIQAAMKDTVRATEEGLKGVDAGVIVTQDAEVLIRELAAVVANSQDAINEVYTITRQQVNTLEEIAIGVERVERIAQRNLTSAHTIETTALDVSRLAHDLRQNLTGVHQNADDNRKQDAGNANDNPQQNSAA